MEPPPPPLKVRARQDTEDRISVLPDDLLIGILERLHLREALRAGAASTRWRHLPHQLSRLHLVTADFQHRTRATPGAIYEAFTGAIERFLTASACPDQCERSRATVKTLRLGFDVVTDPGLMASVARAVERVVSRGETECFEFGLYSQNGAHSTAARLAENGQRLMSFSRACPVAFRWLTRLDLRHLAFGDSDVGGLVRACDKLRHLKLISCKIPESLKIDAPSSELQVLQLLDCGCTQIQLVSVPKLRELACHDWLGKEPLVHSGDAPSLREVYLSFVAPPGAHTQFALSELLPRNLSILRLSFGRKMIWIQPEYPKRLTPIFSNTREVYLYDIFSQCDLNWTMFILQAAPSLQKFHLSRHSCASDDAEKTNMSWEPSKNLKHFNLRSMVMVGFVEEHQVVMNYIRLVVERATCLERIELIRDTNFCHACKNINHDSARRFPTDEACRHRVRERLTHGFSSLVQIIISQY